MVSIAGGHHTPLFQGLPRGDTGQPPIYHNLQYHYLIHHTQMVNGGVRGGDSLRGPWAVDTAPGGVFIPRQWHDRANVGGTPTTGFRRIHGPL